MASSCSPAGTSTLAIWKEKRAKWYRSGFPLMKLQSPEFNLTSLLSHITDLLSYSVACIKWLVIFDRFRGIICHILTIIWCRQLTSIFWVILCNVFSLAILSQFICIPFRWNPFFHLSSGHDRSGVRSGIVLIFCLRFFLFGISYKLFFSFQ